MAYELALAILLSKNEVTPLGKHYFYRKVRLFPMILVISLSLFDITHSIILILFITVIVIDFPQIIVIEPL